tara:strand:+ start:238 stop:1101 length:864 start_codon:yes stop_codon:yes gene_type:complete
MIAFLPTLALLLAASTAQAQTEADAVHTYRSPDGEALSAYVFHSSSPDPAPAIILLHGGGWAYGSPAWMESSARRLADQDMVAISVQYRLSRNGVTPVDALHDTCASLAWVREQASSLGVDPSRIAAYGVSAGGHLAASMATVGCPDGTQGPDLLVLYSPAIRTSQDGWFQRLLGQPDDPAEYSPFEHVSETTPATLIISGEQDTLTPHAYAMGYCDRLHDFQTECEIETFNDVGHLLTRNLDNQESDFDVAEEDIARARHAISAFLGRHRYINDMTQTTDESAPEG